MALSHTAEDYPAPGRPLSDGSLAACRAAIHHLEAAGVAWPLPPDGTPPGSRPPTLANGKRLRQIRQQRAAARAAGESDALYELAVQIGKLSSLVYSALPTIYRAELDAANVDLLGDLEVDVLYLAEWAEVMGRQLEARLGELPLRQKIQALRSKTTANGCTPAEQQQALAAADRLERRLALVLAS